MFKIALLKTSLPVAMICAYASIANADIAHDRDALCSKARSCAAKEAVSQGIPPEFVEMMKPMFDSQCVVEVNKYAQSVIEANLQDQAHACVESLQNTSCETLVASYKQSTPPTAACDEFQEAASEAGIELEPN